MLQQPRLMFAMALLLALMPSVNAQEVRATILGTVTDASDAAVPGAKIKVTYLDRNQTVEVQSNDTGTFVTPFLTPGLYRVEVEAQGFQKYVRENMTLQAQDRVRLDIKLTLGELTQSVSVTGSATQLETETASRSQVVASEIIANLPTQGRNPFQIAWAAAGVVKSGSWRYLRSFDIGGTTEDRQFSLEIGRCFGACGLAPVMLVNDAVHHRVKPKRVNEIVAQYAGEPALVERSA